jgi:hypothetical protein
VAEALVVVGKVDVWVSVATVPVGLLEPPDVDEDAAVEPLETAGLPLVGVVVEFAFEVPVVGLGSVDILVPEVGASVGCSTGLLPHPVTTSAAPHTPARMLVDNLTR